MTTARLWILVLLLFYDPPMVSSHGADEEAEAEGRQYSAGFSLSSLACPWFWGLLPFSVNHLRLECDPYLCPFT